MTFIEVAGAVTALTGVIGAIGHLYVNVSRFKAEHGTKVDVLRDEVTSVRLTIAGDYYRKAEIDRMVERLSRHIDQRFDQLNELIQKHMTRSLGGHE